MLVTLGVRPTRPDTGYGYIQVGAEAGQRMTVALSPSNTQTYFNVYAPGH